MTRYPHIESHTSKAKDAAILAAVILLPAIPSLIDYMFRLCGM